MHRRIQFRRQQRDFAGNASGHGWFTEGFDTLDLKDANADIAEHSRE
jgi:hypothetical protein